MNAEGKLEVYFVLVQPGTEIHWFEGFSPPSNKLLRATLKFPGIEQNCFERKAYVYFWDPIMKDFDYILTED